MSTENRDWYRDWWRKKTGYVERADFRRPAAVVEREKELAFSNWHPVLKAIAIVAVLLFVFVVARLVLKAVT